MLYALSLLLRILSIVLLLLLLLLSLSNDINLIDAATVAAAAISGDYDR